MKTISILFASAVCFTTPVWADYQKGSHSLALSLGSAGFGEDVDVNNGDNRLDDEGGAGGLQYLYFIKGSPALAVGIDASWIGFEDEHASRIISGESKSNSDMGVYQGVAKLAFPRGRFRPYLFAGAGMATSQLRSHITTASGVIETFNSRHTTLAGSWGVGMDIFFGKRFFLGPEIRQVFLARKTHTPTAAAQTLGIRALDDPDNISSFFLRIGWKFGA